MSRAVLTNFSHDVNAFLTKQPPSWGVPKSPLKKFIRAGIVDFLNSYIGTEEGIGL